MSLTVLELDKEQFFPQLFANDLLTISRVTATSFRFAAFLWHNTNGEQVQDRSAWSSRQWQHHLANPGREFYAIYCDGEPAGCCEISRAARLMQSSGGTARIEALGLLPEFQGEGLGADILTRIVEKALATGARRLLIGSSINVTPAVLKLFQNQGFKAPA